MADNVWDALTSKQRKAVVALMTEPSIRAAAQAIGVNERTISRWLHGDANFQAALAQEEGRAIDDATRRLVVLQPVAIHTLTALLADKKTTPTVRLRAATAVLDYLLKLRELRNVEIRLARLEERINGDH